jgi:hypothetical protein
VHESKDERKNDERNFTTIPDQGRGRFLRALRSGHINDTYRVETDAGALYILQRINTHVFPNVAGLMQNIASVTEFLSKHAKDPREAMHLVRALDGAPYVVDAESGCWRVYDFVTGSVCLQKIERAQDFYECAYAFGNFQQMMAAFPAETLSETIPNFHNTPDRYQKLSRAIAEDRMHRVKDVRKRSLLRYRCAGSWQTA